MVGLVVQRDELPFEKKKLPKSHLYRRIALV